MINDEVGGGGAAGYQADDWQQALRSGIEGGLGWSKVAVAAGLRTMVGSEQPHSGQFGRIDARDNSKSFGVAQLSTLGSSMRTHVTFCSDAFNRTDVRPNFINPCCFGEDVADWLIKRLTDPKLTVAPESCQEDWGWEVFVACNNRRFFIGIGQYEIDGELGWLCFVQSRLPFFKRWFGATDVQEQQQVCAAFHSVLASAPEIRDIRWHMEDNFTKGHETDWKPEPGA